MQWISQTSLDFPWPLLHTTTNHQPQPYINPLLYRRNVLPRYQMTRTIILHVGVVATIGISTKLCSCETEENMKAFWGYNEDQSIQMKGWHCGVVDNKVSMLGVNMMQISVILASDKAIGTKFRSCMRRILDLRHNHGHPSYSRSSLDDQVCRSRYLYCKETLLSPWINARDMVNTTAKDPLSEG